MCFAHIKLCHSLWLQGGEENGSRDLLTFPLGCPARSPAQTAAAGPAGGVPSVNEIKGRKTCLLCWGSKAASAVRVGPGCRTPWWGSRLPPTSRLLWGPSPRHAGPGGLVPGAAVPSEAGPASLLTVLTVGMRSTLKLSLAVSQ